MKKPKENHRYEITSLAVLLTIKNLLNSNTPIKDKLNYAAID